MALEKLGAAWKRKSKKGEPMLSVLLTAENLADAIVQLEEGEEQLSLLMLKNKWKAEGSKQPDFNIFLQVDDEVTEDPKPVKKDKTKAKAKAK